MLAFSGKPNLTVANQTSSWPRPDKSGFAFVYLNLISIFGNPSILCRRVYNCRRDCLVDDLASSRVDCRRFDCRRVDCRRIDMLPPYGLVKRVRFSVGAGVWGQPITVQNIGCTGQEVTKLTFEKKMYIWPKYEGIDVALPNSAQDQSACAKLCRDRVFFG